MSEGEGMQGKDSDDYQAMDSKDKAARHGLVLRMASGETVHLKYPDIHLKRVQADQAAMIIYAYSLNILLYGRHLRALAEAMDGEFIAWVQEFDSKRWSEPTGADTILVERIQLFYKKDEGGEGASATGKGAEGAVHRAH